MRVPHYERENNDVLFSDIETSTNDYFKGICLTPYFQVRLKGL